VSSGPSPRPIAPRYPQLANRTEEAWEQPAAWKPQFIAQARCRVVARSKRRHRLGLRTTLQPYWRVLGTARSTETTLLWRRPRADNVRQSGRVHDPRATDAHTSARPFGPGRLLGRDVPEAIVWQVGFCEQESSSRIRHRDLAQISVRLTTTIYCVPSGFNEHPLGWVKKNTCKMVRKCVHYRLNWCRRGTGRA